MGKRSRSTSSVPTLNFKGARLTGTDSADFVEYGSSKAMPILLPNQWDPLQHIGIDIGGSLAKIVWFDRVDDPTPDTSINCLTASSSKKNLKYNEKDKALFEDTQKEDSFKKKSVNKSLNISDLDTNSYDDSGVSLPKKSNNIKSKNKNVKTIKIDSNKEKSLNDHNVTSPLIQNFLNDTGRTNLALGGMLRFMMFEVVKLEEGIEFIRQIFINRGIKPENIPNQIIRGTGGGAHKFSKLFKDKLGISITKDDEMECLVTGLNFLVKEIPNEVFTYDEKRNPAFQHYEIKSPESSTNSIVASEISSLNTSDNENDNKKDNIKKPKLDKGVEIKENNDELSSSNNSSNQYDKPYLIVNIGSGVSIIKVTGEDTYERVSGTSFGGGTFWGLLSLLTDVDDYDSVLEDARHGNNKNVDMLVSDIYGGNYSKIGLKGNAIASTFGKVFKIPKEKRKEEFKKEDIAISLLYLVCNNIGQIAYLLAQSHGADRIFFSGFFIRNHPITMYTLSYAVDFWSKGSIKALFTRHEGFFGAMGAFLQQSYQKPREHRFSYAGTSDGDEDS